MPAKNVPARYWSIWKRISPCHLLPSLLYPFLDGHLHRYGMRLDDFRCWDAAVSKVRQATHSQLSISIDRSREGTSVLDLFHPASPGSWP